MGFEPYNLLQDEVLSKEVYNQDSLRSKLFGERSEPSPLLSAINKGYSVCYILLFFCELLMGFEPLQSFARRSLVKRSL